jgi:hypothetical protein
MEPVAGIFSSRAAAKRVVERLRSEKTPDDRIVLLTPGTGDVEAAVETSDTEQEGMGRAMGGAVGAAMGVAGGASLGAAAASLVVPGVGPVLAAGILAAAVLGVGGAVTGAVAGEALEDNITSGLPHDELFVYEDALRKGKSVIIVFTEDDEEQDRLREIFAREGAETVDAAREDWWIGLRDAEQEQYMGRGGNFNTDEVSYRRGFEAALNAKVRGRIHDQADSDLKRFYSESGVDAAFRAGYERGLAHQKRLEEGTKRATRASG